MFDNSTIFVLTSGTLFWSIIIVALVILFLLSIRWIHKHNIKPNRSEWFIGITGLLLFLFTIQNFLGSLEESTPQAAYMFLLVTGLPAVILSAISWQLVTRRIKAKS
ncbi:dehalogenase [Dehalococcoides mccartyi CG1]|jgi:quinol-cytochrome oxidoreductase complex cytochrome b subunit|uniref:hypothetical protein n=1 Tax=Dehalococcoides mccartyi TaxID=61435 RepID=UPI0004E0AC58|nr:hypothetical protein [Dehalococcoides mccartyi]AII58468.1 dehalogenase [Dehalococcoides mccartyi CG1]